LKPSTFTEQCIREIYEEKFNKTQNQTPNSFLTTNMLDESLIGKEPDPAEIENLIEAKKLDLERMNKNFEKKAKKEKEIYEK
jgi:hypothetical protein